jgi:hypothetical protein
MLLILRFAIYAVANTAAGEPSLHGRSGVGLAEPESARAAEASAQHCTAVHVRPLGGAQTN